MQYENNRFWMRQRRRRFDLLTRRGWHYVGGLRPDATNGCLINNGLIPDCANWMKSTSAEPGQIHILQQKATGLASRLRTNLSPQLQYAAIVA